MDGLSFVIAFGSLVVAGLSIYLSYRARTSPYREMLYSKQLEGYSEVVDALTDFFIAAQLFIASEGCRLDDDTRPKLRLKTMPQHLAFINKHKKWFIFLPKEIEDALIAYVKLFSGISAPPDEAQNYPKDIVNADDPGKLLSDAYNKVAKAARKHLGIESLSQETVQLFRNVPRTED